MKIFMMIMFSFFSCPETEPSEVLWQPGLQPGETGLYQNGFIHEKLNQSGSSATRDKIIDEAMESLENVYDANSHRFSLSPRWIPGSLLRVSPEQIKTVVPEGSIERYTNFEVTYLEKDRRQTSSIQIMVETERKLPVAAERIINGKTIEEEDLEIRWVSVPYDRGQLVEDIEQLKGKTIRRTLSPGQPVRHADVSSEYIVEAGDTIRLIFEENGLHIELKAEARQSGAQDEEIKIYNDETRRRYLGKITGPGVVKWIKTL